MKLSFFIMFSLMIFSSCSNSLCKKSKANKTSNTSTKVGADQDEHGCKASAGYQWSELKQECVRPFELPMNILSPDKTTITSVLFSSDSSHVEIFSVDGHFILEKSASGHYEKRLKHQSAHLDRNENGNWYWVFEN
jgi:hypothetical protein